MELIQGQDVFSILSNWDDPLPESIIKYFFREIYKAVLELHSQSAAHGRLVAEHIMVSDDYFIKLINFSEWSQITPRLKKGEMSKLGRLLFSFYTKKPLPEECNQPSKLKLYLKRYNCEKCFKTDEPLKMISLLLDPASATNPPTLEHSYFTSGSISTAVYSKFCLK